jgi:restriction endonuclease Mrr
MYRHTPPQGATGATVGFAMGAVLATIVGLCSLVFLAYHVQANRAFGLGDFVLSLIFFGCVAVIVWLEQHYAAYVAQQQAIQAQQEQRAREEAAQRDRKAYPDRIGALQGLLKLTPSQFEIAIADLLKFWGYSNVEHTGGSGDLAVDVVCYDATGQKTIVQCKHYMPGNLVSLPEVQTFIDMMVAQHPACAGIYVTTSGYTESALALSQTDHIMMIDGTSLVDHFQQFRAAMEQQD